jgi:hypothetical protein
VVPIKEERRGGMRGECDAIASISEAALQWTADAGDGGGVSRSGWASESLAV